MIWESGERNEINGMDKRVVMTIEFQLAGQQYLALNGEANLNTMKRFRL